MDNFDEIFDEDATLYDKELENPARHKTLFINKTHILWATPEENQK